MNKRISKKIHKNYLSDFGSEIASLKSERAKLENLGINDVIHYEINTFPEVFWKLIPRIKKHYLSYSVEKVTLKEIPATESSWWSITENTTFYKVYPTRTKSPCWFMALN
jgi:hypothetical protein